MLRRIVNPKRNEVTGERRKPRYQELTELHTSTNLLE
jgi:hypothetical protein